MKSRISILAASIVYSKFFVSCLDTKATVRTREYTPMKEIATRRLKDVLTRQFGFVRGNDRSTGHDTWVDRQDRRIHPVMRHKSVSLASLYCTGMEMEAQGVCSRTKFLRSFRG